MTDTTEPHVSFVTVNWNQRELTLLCLQSLREIHYGRYSVILVDNGSEDDSVSVIRKRFPEVTVIENGANLGIAAANNVGIRHALAESSDYVFLLNNDTVVDPEMLRMVVDVAERSPDVGITGPTVLYDEKSDTISCAGNSIDWRNASTTLLRDGEPFSAVADLDPCQVDFISSCAVCIKSMVFASAGLMEESYFIYYDETDWFARATSTGWRTVYVPKARIWHKVSATMKPASPATTYYMTRNRLLFVGRNMRGLRRLATFARCLAEECRTLAAHSLRPRHMPLRASRTARLLALRDAFLGRFGKMGNDVMAICYPGRQI